ncbi:MAG TPA: hypothetical protein VFQ23_10010, partial [Anaerolineales bacterium]|nr:hypothetical protein [Anaerolineales bacterium]
MYSKHNKIAVLILMIVILSACGGQALDSATPPSQPTEVVVPAISSPTGAETSTSLPVSTDTSIPASTDTAAPATEPPTATQPAVVDATVSFANDVLPIIQSRCINCHGGDRTEEGLVLL